MNFYSFHIGDYAAHTRHLTPIEDLAYRRMLDLYYTSEAPLPLDINRLARLIGLRDHMTEVETVVGEFFEQALDGFRSKRCDEEIAIYRNKIEQASRAGQASAQRRFNARSADGSTDVQPTNPMNQSQSHEPIPTKKPTSADASEVLPDALDATAWGVFTTHRKQLKKKLTPLSARKQIAFLIQYDKPTQQAIVDQTVRNGWTGLFELKGGFSNAPQLTTEQQRVASLQRSASGRVQLAAERELAKLRTTGQGNGDLSLDANGKTVRPSMDIVVRG